MNETFQVFSLEIRFRIRLDKSSSLNPANQKNGIARKVLGVLGREIGEWDVWESFF
jgi:hypothetical protein